MENIALLLSYDGKNYHGWQKQNNAVSVQQTLEQAAKTLFGCDVDIVGCGRTDAGVHAINYVANFKVETKIPQDKLAFALNALLPNDIRVKQAQFVSKDFHSRFDVLKKRYIYKIYNFPINDVFLLGRAWHVKYPLDIEKMKSAAYMFLGEHDFAAFRSTGTDTKTSVRTIYDLSVSKNGNEIVVDICADGFLYNMVRIISGTLVYVGCGKIDYRDVSKIIESCDRRLAGITAPPDGLYMHSVLYDDKFGISWS